MAWKKTNFVKFYEFERKKLVLTVEWRRWTTPLSPLSAATCQKIYFSLLINFCTFVDQKVFRSSNNSTLALALDLTMSSSVGLFEDAVWTGGNGAQYERCRVHICGL